MSNMDLIIGRTPRLAPPISARDHIRGPRNAPLTLVEYGDFECPHCGAAYPVVEAILSQMGNDLSFAYRHFPLAQVHPHAVQAAEAAEAAGAQDHFWPMHNLLFEHQDALDSGSLLSYASILQLDVSSFTRDVATRVYESRVQDDVISGVQSGVSGTPTFFVNGVRYDGPRDLASMLRLLTELRRRVQLNAG
jgi:protein-disulfide isomerase